MKRILLILIYFILFLSTYITGTFNKNKIKQQNQPSNLPISNSISANANALLQAIQAHQEAMIAADIAVNAYSQAVASCQVNVSCGDAKNQLLTAKTYQKTASQASTRSKEAFGVVNNAAAAARNFLSNLEKNVNESENNMKATADTAKITDLAVKQAELAAKATANAVATCELIVNVTCNVCPTISSAKPNSIVENVTSRRSIDTGNVFTDAKTLLGGA